MARILITSGPTRQYLDPVRYLTNASSGRMGCALAEVAVERGHETVIVSGPVDIEYPSSAEIVSVVSTEEMLAACREIFPSCDGMIGCAAPCDYRPIQVKTHKISKTGEPLRLELIETDDVVATLGLNKGARWMVGFALETNDQRLRALAKLEKKSCDFMVINGPEAMHSLENAVEILDPSGTVIAAAQGDKRQVADRIFDVLHDGLLTSTTP